MNKQRIHNIIQYTLLMAGQEDDFFDRDLGPIHFIKYVYLADLNYATYNKGETYTGTPWKFHNFGPWSNDVNDCIQPALDEIGADCKILPSQYEDGDDYKRWSISDDRLLEELGVKLPITVSGAVASLVHKFKKDTPSLLDHVYKTEPMLKAAPGEFLDFSSTAKPIKEKVEGKPKWDGLTIKKQKKFQQALKAIRKKKQARKVSKRKGFIPSPLPDLHDDVYFNGLDWVDRLAGNNVIPGNYKANFSDSVWHSKTREGNFPE